MGAREIYEASWFFFCVILASDIVPHKIFKKLSIFYVFLKFYGVLGVYGQSKGENVINQHSA